MAADPRVDAYLAALPADQRRTLEHLRAAVARLVPQAEETISYDMPAFKLAGRFLLSYAGWKRHCSIYPLTNSFLDSHREALKRFERTKGSLHFTPDAPLPDELLEDLVRALVADQEGGRR